MKKTKTEQIWPTTGATATVVALHSSCNASHLLPFLVFYLAQNCTVVEYTH